LIFAFIGLVLIFPFFCLVAIAIKLESKGPIFYQQNRCTENGKTFKILKFRSMVDNAEALTGPQWASENDPRITRVGNFLRRYRIDEIPQIWNVLRGDMSFVGPRPERPEFVKQLSQEIPYYEERHSVKPGITGWAQVCYRYGASTDDALEKLKYDLFYVKNMSFALDLLILFRTIKIMLLHSGAR
jgi:exopolysaccharide biosynthesis polyprenyl glycosylphosphotransferase